jgi:hypothetical protein
MRNSTWNRCPRESRCSRRSTNVESHKSERLFRDREPQNANEIKSPRGTDHGAISKREQHDTKDRVTRQGWGGAWDMAFFSLAGFFSKTMGFHQPFPFLAANMHSFSGRPGRKSTARTGKAARGNDAAGNDRVNTRRPDDRNRQ